MASYVVPPVYAAFIWWFSTGAVLLLVGLSTRFDPLRIGAAILLFGGALFGVASTGGDTTVSAAYSAFTFAILVWGAQEIAFLAGWITGPRPEPCPDDAKGWRRLSLALQAILYHELALIASGLAILALTWQSDNQVAIWTFAALWILRQSAKINLFLGVPVTNDELMPDTVRFLKTFFARRSVSAFFPISVTLATAVLVLLIQRIVEVAANPFEVANWALISTLFALGVLEHWFMLLPLPAMTLWGWGVRSSPLSEEPAAEPDTSRGAVVLPISATVPLLSGAPSTLPNENKVSQVVELAMVRTDIRNDQKPSKSAAACARQRLEDEFRQTFLEKNRHADLTAPRMNIGAESATNFNGRS